LSDDERCFLRRASIFVGDFDATAAAKIMGADQSHIDALIARSLVLRNPDNRFELHPLVREYSQQKLNEFRRDRIELSVTFSTHYLEVARTAGAQINDDATVEHAVARLDIDLPNIRHAWMIALGDRDFARLVHGVRALHCYFELRHFHADAEAMFRNALSWVGTDQTTFAAADDELTRFLLARHGVQLLRIGRIEEARRQLTAALSIARRAGNLDETAFCLSALAQVERSSGDALRALEHARDALAAARESKDVYVLGAALRDAALVAAASDSLETAVGYLREATEIDIASTFRRDAWRGLLELGKQLIARGNSSSGIAALSRIVDHPHAMPELRLEAARTIGLAKSDNATAPLLAIPISTIVESKSSRELGVQE
jgi:tetratricopeptide (TPR) repeat protein